MRQSAIHDDVHGVVEIRLFGEFGDRAALGRGIDQTGHKGDVGVAEIVPIIDGFDPVGDAGASGFGAPLQPLSPAY